MTSIHDFFGASVVQAMYCETNPLLPKRLAYPEHIPAKAHDQFFYNDSDDLLQRLRGLLLNIKLKSNYDVRDFVSQYDWGHQTQVYDDLLENLIRI